MSAASSTVRMTDSCSLIAVLIGKVGLLASSILLPIVASSGVNINLTPFTKHAFKVEITLIK